MFPLFRLPILTVHEVVKTMSHREILLVSLLSNRAKRAVRASIPKSSVHLTFDERERDGLLVRSNSLNFFFDFNLIRFMRRIDRSLPVYKFGPEAFRIVRRGTEDCVEPEDPDHTDDETFKRSMIHYFVETFNPVVSLIGADNSRGLTAELVKYFRERNVKMRKVEIYRIPNKEEFTEIMNCCSNIESLDINMSQPSDFEYTPSGPFTTKKLFLNGYYIKLEDFLQCEMLRINDHEDRFAHKKTPETFNAFFKAWLATDSSLTDFSICYDHRINFPRIVEGLSDRPIQNGRSIEIQKNGRWFRLSQEEYYINLAPIR